MEDEYELIPLNPIRRLEKKIETIEKHTASQETIKEVIDIIKSNQEIVELPVDRLRPAEQAAVVQIQAHHLDDLFDLARCALRGGQRSTRVFVKPVVTPSMIPLQPLEKPSLRVPYPGSPAGLGSEPVDCEVVDLVAVSLTWRDQSIFAGRE